MDIYARRLLWLFVIGIAHSYLIWNGDVLYHYAICGFLLFPFRSLKTKNLLLIVAFLSVLHLTKSYDQTIRRKGWLQDYEQAISIPENQRSDEDLKKIDFWQSRTTEKAPDTSKVEIKKPTYLAGLKETYKHASVHKGNLYYQGLLFPSLIVMILGIALYRQGIFRNYKIWKRYWIISFGILAIGLTVNYLRYYHWTYEYFKPVTEVWKGWLFTFPKELLGIGYVLVLNGVYQKYLKSIRFKTISNIGKMALTNYIFQNSLLGIIFYGYGLAQFNQLSRFELLGIVICIWTTQIILCWLWLKRFKQGPLEWLWRKLTYRSFT